MLAIHSVHRRLAELHLIGRQRPWTHAEVIDLHHCLQVNAKLVQRLDELKQLAYVAHVAGDMEWEQEICRQIDELEAKMI